MHCSSVANARKAETPNTVQCGREPPGLALPAAVAPAALEVSSCLC